MDSFQIKQIANNYFSPLTLLRNKWRRKLEEAILWHPNEFVGLLVRQRLRPDTQLSLVNFFFDLAIIGQRIDERYRRHIDLVYYYHLELWPSSVNVVRTHLSKYPEYQFTDLALFY